MSPFEDIPLHRDAFADRAERDKPIGDQLARVQGELNKLQQEENSGPLTEEKLKYRINLLVQEKLLEGKLAAD